MHALVQTIDVPLVALHLLHAHLSRSTQSDDDRRRQCPAAHAALLAAAVDHRTQADPRPASDVQRTHALRPVHLVRGDREQTRVHLLHVHRDLTATLGRIRVEEHALLTADPADLLHGLHHADLIVDMHHGDERGVWADRVLQLLQIDDTVSAYAQVCHLEALLDLQAPARRQNALVLSLRRHNVLLLASIERGDALDRQIVRLRRP
mmetsp:Transcript_91930/g.265179  ORF Transcript_91930/g.265179 Transcript_91930/m.265179 type:complete len:207 (+) Transcript_91930:634-1254(+)